MRHGCAVPASPECVCDPCSPARDKFFDQQRETFVAQARQVKERIASMCNPPDCDRQLRLADEEETAGLARIENQRQSARVKAE